MTEDNTPEGRLNEFYRVSWALVDDLTLIDIPDNDPVRAKVSDFVGAVQRSHTLASTKGYAAAYADLEKASVGMIGLCRYKDTNLPGVDIDLSRECAQA